jgi:DNA polymerase-3 subunit alpha
MDIEVLPPDINESDINFSVPQNKKIRFGLNAIKNVGHNIVEAIVSERKNNGAYISIADFIERVQSKDLNKKSLESLIRSGAFDQFEERNKLLANVEQMLNYAREIQKARQNQQASLFGSNPNIHSVSFKLLEADPATPKERLTWEKELLGLYVSEHPIKHYVKKLSTQATLCNNLTQNWIGRRVKIGGLISKIKKINTRAGQPMLFVEIEDLSGKIEVVVFNRVLEQTAGSWQQDRIVLVGGRLSDHGGNLKILCDNVKIIE